MKNYKRLLVYIKPYLGLFGLAIICIICASGANLYLPWIIKDMIDKVLAERDMAMLNFISVSIVVVFPFRKPHLIVASRRYGIIAFAF